MTTDSNIPERFKGVKLTKAGKPDTRSKLGREFQAYLDAQRGGITHTDEHREALRAEGEKFAQNLDSLTNPDNFADYGQDAPNPPATTPEPESAPVSEKTALEPPPRLGSHESAQFLLRMIHRTWPDTKPTDFVAAVLPMLRNAQNYGRLWGDLTRKGY